MAKANRLKYQGTTVTPEKSAAEISALVKKYGGTRFEQRWGPDQELVGIRFAIPAEPWGEVPVRLEAKTDTIIGLLRETGKYTQSSPAVREHKLRQLGYRMAWRQLKDFVDQSLLAVKTGLFPLVGAFMAHVEVETDGKILTMSDLLEKHAIMAPSGHALRLMPGSD